MKRTMAEERLYSIKEAAEKIGVSHTTIATWIRLGIATASRQDELGRNRYTDADLLEMERRFQERQARKRGPQPRTALPVQYGGLRGRERKEDACRHGC